MFESWGEAVNEPLEEKFFNEPTDVSREAEGTATET